jgi:hypothetical protein
MRTAVLVLVLCGCAESQYTFVAQSLPVPNPSRGAALGEGQATAADGFTKHRWASYSEQETCFESRLEDLQAEYVSQTRPFILMGFKDKHQKLDTVAKISSTKIEIKSSGQENVDTTERAMAFPHVDVQVCFANPGRVITSETTFVVLKVPYSSDYESAGASGSRDGVWRLTR